MRRVLAVVHGHAHVTSCPQSLSLYTTVVPAPPAYRIATSWLSANLSLSSAVDPCSMAFCSSSGYDGRYGLISLCVRLASSAPWEDTKWRRTLLHPLVPPLQLLSQLPFARMCLVAEVPSRSDDRDPRARVSP